MGRKGFTLIELLVVVLIIGILATVALPRYERATAKTRASLGLASLLKLVKAQERYFMAAGSYTTDLEALDIEMADTKDYKFYCDLNFCRAESNFKKQIPTFDGYFAHGKFSNMWNKRICCVWPQQNPSPQLPEDVCVSLGGTNRRSDSSGVHFNLYNLP